MKAIKLTSCVLPTEVLDLLKTTYKTTKTRKLKTHSPVNKPTILVSFTLFENDPGRRNNKVYKHLSLKGHEFFHELWG